MVHTLVLVRHGESTWNQLNKFTGWTDVPLSENGIQEAIEGGKQLDQENYKFDYVFTSLLKRAIKTMNIILEETDQMHLPIEKSWRLNERHYGALQGLNKAETAAKHGEEQVQIWRRSYDIPPPPLEDDDERHPKNDEKYQNLDTSVLPSTESLKLTAERFLPFWYDRIAPMIKDGKKVLIVAHGNSLRALVQHLDKLTEKEVLDLNIPTAVPLVYHLDENLSPLKHFYLGNQEEIQKKIASVSNQGKAK